MISILAGLQGISTDLYEAAAIDGATAVKRFIYITLPQLKPILISIAMLDFICDNAEFFSDLAFNGRRSSTCDRDDEYLCIHDSVHGI